MERFEAEVIVELFWYIFVISLLVLNTYFLIHWIAVGSLGWAIVALVGIVAGVYSLATLWGA